MPLPQDIKEWAVTKPTWTLSEIRALNEEAGYHFFSKETMKFFGDTMKTLRVKNIDGVRYVYRAKGRPAIWQFNPETGNLSHESSENIHDQIYGRKVRV